MNKQTFMLFFWVFFIIIFLWKIVIQHLSCTLNFTQTNNVSTKSIKLLEQRLSSENRKLSEDDREVAFNATIELAALYRKWGIESFTQKYKAHTLRNPGFLSRIILYESDKLVIRGHIFEKTTNEKDIHNHGQSFFSVCLQGSYLHSLWEILPDNGKHYLLKRKPGGQLTSSEEASGSLSLLDSYLFRTGDSYYISASSLHSVTEPQGPLITIIIRDAEKLTPESTFYFSEPVNRIVFKNINEIADPQPVFESFFNALNNHLRIEESNSTGESPGDGARYVRKVLER